MTGVLRWRKQKGLTQAEAAERLGVSQPYLSLLESGARPLTGELRERMKAAAGEGHTDDLFCAQLSALGYPGFAHVRPSRSRPRPDRLLMTVLARPDADARVVEALPWVVRRFEGRFDFGWMVRQAKLANRQDRLGFVLQLAPVGTPEGLSAVSELERARLRQEDTLCWDSMPAATRGWMRANRTALAEHWNVLTRLDAGGAADAA